MKKNLSILIIFTVIYLSGCKGINKNNYELLNEILSTINAKSGNIFFTEDLMTENSSKKYYVEFIVNNCEMINDGADPKLVASFIASELFKKLDKKSFEKNYGYEIAINAENKELHNFFYEKKKVELAVKGMKTIEKYVEFIKENQISKADSFLDLTKTDYVASDFSIQIKNRIGNDYTKTFTLFSEYSDISENDSWVYVTFLIKKDNSFINLKTIINKSDYEKIVYTELN